MSNHVIVEFTSPLTYSITVDGVTTKYKAELIPIPNSKNNESINPAHSDARSRMLEASK